MAASLSAAHQAHQARRTADLADLAGVTGLAGRAGLAVDLAVDLAERRHDERLLPVADELAPLLTQPGLVPGSVLAAQGPGALTLATALAAEVSRRGGWVTAVGLARMGVSAVAERGASLDRWVFVDDPGDAAAEVLNALIGSVDMVLLGVGAPLAAAHDRRLRARLRERGTVVIQVAGGSGARVAAGGGALSAEVTFTVERAAWTGLGRGHGRLIERRAEVVAVGRGAASLPRRAVLWLPDAHGRITAVRGAVSAHDWSTLGVSGDAIAATAADEAAVEGVVIPLQRRAG